MSRELEQARELVRMLEEKEKESKVELSTIKPGGTFLIGDDEFIVLAQGVCGSNTTFVISKGFLAENVKFGNSTDYKESNLRKVIENDILPKIENEIGAENILPFQADLTSVDMQKDCGVLTCKARPITFDEAREYNDLIADKTLSDWWWTCTPWSTKERGWEYSVAAVCPSGGFNDSIYDVGCGVRPVLYLNSKIFVSLQ